MTDRRLPSLEVSESVGLLEDTSAVSTGGALEIGTISGCCWVPILEKWIEPPRRLENSGEGGGGCRITYQQEAQLHNLSVSDQIKKARNKTRTLGWSFSWSSFWLLSFASGGGNWIGLLRGWSRFNCSSLWLFSGSSCRGNWIGLLRSWSRLSSYGGSLGFRSCTSHTSVEIIHY
jgi:hypothetical protein